jgi:hypothetical protein
MAATLAAAEGIVLGSVGDLINLAPPSGSRLETTMLLRNSCSTSHAVFPGFA